MATTHWQASITRRRVQNINISSLRTACKHSSIWRIFHWRRNNPRFLCNVHAESLAPEIRSMWKAQPEQDCKQCFQEYLYPTDVHLSVPYVCNNYKHIVLFSITLLPDELSCWMNLKTLTYWNSSVSISLQICQHNSGSLLLTQPPMRLLRYIQGLVASVTSELCVLGLATSNEIPIWWKVGGVHVQSIKSKLILNYMTSTREGQMKTLNITIKFNGNI